MKDVSVTDLPRTEHDLLGELAVPEHAYYGIHTLRAVENFPISGIRISSYPELVRALAAIKQAAALANRDLELLEEERATAIIAACEAIRSGELHDQFVVDVIQGGAGTSTNMNANEVIANRALEILGAKRGEYHKLHPNEHVNMSQSTNDVYPTAFENRDDSWCQPSHRCDVGITLRIRCKGGRVQRHFENGADPAARRRTHDTGAGVSDLRRHGR